MRYINLLFTYLLTYYTSMRKFGKLIHPFKDADFQYSLVSIIVAKLP